MTRLIEQTAHGVLVVRPIEGSRAELVAQLHPEEAALTQTWGEPRARTFAAGRAALRDALKALGVDVAGPILRSPRGAPLLPPGLRASVSHKDDVAAAIATFEEHAWIGLDLEQLRAHGSDIRSQVLTERERASTATSNDVIIRFSLKEALYKALDPIVQRYVGFHEVEVDPFDDGSARFTLLLKNGEGPFSLEGRWRVLGDLAITTVKLF